MSALCVLGWLDVCALIKAVHRSPYLDAHALGRGRSLLLLLGIFTRVHKVHLEQLFHVCICIRKSLHPQTTKPKSTFGLTTYPVLVIPLPERHGGVHLSVGLGRGRRPLPAVVDGDGEACVFGLFYYVHMKRSNGADRVHAHTRTYQNPAWRCTQTPLRAYAPAGRPRPRTGLCVI